MNNGQPWCLYYRSEEGYLLRFPEFADFFISSSGEKITSIPAPETSKYTIEHLYLNQVLPLALSRQFKLVLHASAVEIGDSAVAFLGDTGRGKSTLAASFSTNGHRLLTDDGLILEKSADHYFVQPSHPSVRLWSDSRRAVLSEDALPTPATSYSSKNRFLAGDELAFCSDTKQLKRLYFLGDGQANSISIDPIPPQVAMIELVRNSFLLDVDEREMASRQFDQLRELISQPIFFRIDYPRDYDLLPDVRAQIVQHVTDGG